MNNTGGMRSSGSYSFMDTKAMPANSLAPFNPPSPLPRRLTYSYAPQTQPQSWQMATSQEHQYSSPNPYTQQDTYNKNKNPQQWIKHQPENIQRMPPNHNLQLNFKTSPFSPNYGPNGHMRNVPMQSVNMPPSYAELPRFPNGRPSPFQTIDYDVAINGPKLGHSMVPIGAEVPDEGITYMM